MSVTRWRASSGAALVLAQYVTVGEINRQAVTKIVDVVIPALHS